MEEVVCFRSCVAEQILPELSLTSCITSPQSSPAKFMSPANGGREFEI
jgi:hypothetical protein